MASQQLLSGIAGALRGANQFLQQRKFDQQQQSQLADETARNEQDRQDKLNREAISDERAQRKEERDQRDSMLRSLLATDKASQSAQKARQEALSEQQKQDFINSLPDNSPLRQAILLGNQSAISKLLAPGDGKTKPVTLTPGQRKSFVKERAVTQFGDKFTEAGITSVETGEDPVEVLRGQAQEGLDRTTGGILGIGSTPAPDSSLSKILQNVENIGSNQNRLATLDSILQGQIFPELGLDGGGQQAQTQQAGGGAEEAIRELQTSLGGRVPTQEEWKQFFRDNPDQAQFAEQIIGAIGVSGQ